MKAASSTAKHIMLAQLDELKDRAFKEVRETFCRTVKGDESTLTFSAHALDRCFERRISLRGVLDALRQGTCVKGSGMKDG